MRNSFDLLNDIFDWCVADEEIMRMLGVTDNTNTDVLKNKLRLECQADEAVTATEVPFIAYYFTRAEKLEHNWLVNKGELYVDIYADALSEAGRLSKRFRQLLFPADPDRLQLLLFAVPVRNCHFQKRMHKRQSQL